MWCYPLLYDVLLLLFPMAFLFVQRRPVHSLYLLTYLLTYLFCCGWDQLPCTADYVLQRTKNNFEERGLCQSGSAAWNSLPFDLHDVINNNTFKNDLSIWNHITFRSRMATTLRALATLRKVWRPTNPISNSILSVDMKKTCNENKGQRSQRMSLTWSERSCRVVLSYCRYSDR